MVMSFFLTLFCMIKLLECKAKTPGGSFTDIGFKAMGLKGKYLVDVFLSTAQLGFVTAYIYFIMTSLSQVIQDSFGQQIDYRWFGMCYLRFKDL
jgi:amino acid permease